MFAYCRNNPVCRVDISGTEDAVAYSDEELLSSQDLEQLTSGGGSSYGGSSGQCGVMGGSNASHNSNQDDSILPLEYYIGKKAPKFADPNSEYTNYSYNDYTGKFEKSTAYYDFAGRQVYRIDWTNHGRSDHGNPHFHVIYYDNIYPNGIERRLN